MVFVPQVSPMFAPFSLSASLPCNCVWQLLALAIVVVYHHHICVFDTIADRDDAQVISAPGDPADGLLQQQAAQAQLKEAPAGATREGHRSAEAAGGILPDVQAPAGNGAGGEGGVATTAGASVSASHDTSAGAIVATGILLTDATVQNVSVITLMSGFSSHNRETLGECGLDGVYARVVVQLEGVLKNPESHAAR